MAPASRKKGQKDPEKAVSDMLRAADSGEVSPVYLFIGELPVTSPHVSALVERLLPEGAEEMNLQELSDEDAAPGRCVEFLETRGFFPGRKVLHVKEPTFLQSKSTAGTRWKRVLNHIEKKDAAKAITALSRLLGDLGCSPQELLEMKASEMRTELKWPNGLSRDALLTFIQEHSGEIEPSPSSISSDTEILKRWIEERARPEQAVLVIQASGLDRKSAIYRAIVRCGQVADFAPAKDEKSLRQQAAATVKGYVSRLGATIEPRALDMLVELVGEKDIPGLLQEAEKLVSLARGDGKKDGKVRISVAHVRDGVVRKREEEIFRLTGAISSGDTQAALESLNLVLSQGIYPPLALLGAMNNALKRVVALHAAASATVGLDRIRRVSYSQFKGQVLSELKSYFSESGTNPLGGHPYALFKQCREAAAADLTELLELFRMIAEADLELKGGACDPQMVLEMLVIRMTSGGIGG